ncbi:MAG: ABC transporter ATP-binding protein [Victivallales bacterium]|nr:ABC transporter ATP-binding protein [Victivallales bacterium]
MRKFWSDIRYLLDRRDLLRFACLLASLVVNSLLELLSLAAVPVFIAMLLSGGQSNGSPTQVWLARLGSRCGVATPAGLLWFCGVLVLVANGARMLWMLFCISLQARMLNNRKVALSSRLLEQYLRAPAAFHTVRNSSDLINRVVVECDHVLQHVAAPLLEFLQNGVVILCICALLFCTIPGMTAVAVLALAFFGGGFLAFHQKRMRRLGAQEQDGRTKAMTAAAETLDGRVEATFLGKRHFFIDRFHRAMELVTNAQRAYDVQIRVIWPYLEFVSLSVILLVTLASLYLRHGDLATVAPQIALLGMALVRLRSNVINLMHSWTLLRYHRVSLQVVCEDLRQFDSIAERLPLADEDALPPCPFEHTIELKGVTFRHPGAAEDTLKDLTLTIARGESVGIVGPTGGGKSTLLQILAGTLTPDAGSITIDGKALAGSQVPAWQHRIGYIPQQLFLMDDTLEANLALGVPHDQIDRPALDTAIAAAQLDDVVSTLPQGLATRLGEQGARLSGGQRQRIAIARTLYRQPDVLFCDEATSALDTETEARLATALAHLGEHRTLVMVTHRLATVRHCDRIFVLDQGRLVATGTYEELLETSPVFRELANQDK